MGDPYLFQSIAAAVIGGVSILGGRGHYLGAVAGSVMLVSLVSLLLTQNMPDWGRNVVYGVAILVILLSTGVSAATSSAPGTTAVVDLSHPLEEEMPVWPTLSRFFKELWCSIHVVMAKPVLV